uniref:HOOK domain-containing protein n=1 Tax=Rhabditophanes sp. KR3021 TaxID=114890 RepID=A0AC35TVE1_9BILA
MLFDMNEYLEHPNMQVIVSILTICFCSLVLLVKKVVGGQSKGDSKEGFDLKRLHDFVTKVKEQEVELNQFRTAQVETKGQKEELEKMGDVLGKYEKVLIKLTDSEKEVKKLSGKLSETELESGKLEKQNEEIQELLLHLKQVLAEDESKIGGMDNKMRLLESEVCELKSTNTTLEHRFNEAQLALTGVADTLKTCELEKNDSEAMSNKLKASLQLLTKEHEKLTREFMELSEMFKGSTKSEKNGWSDLDEEEDCVVKSGESVMDIAKIRAQATKLENDIKVVEKQLAQETEAKQTLQATVTSLERQLLKCKAEILAKKSESSESSSHMEKLLNMLNVKEGKIGDLEEACNKLRNELSTITNRYHEVSNEKSKIESKFERTENEKKDLKEKVDKLKVFQFQEMNKLQTKIKNVEEVKNLEIEYLKSKVSSVESFTVASQMISNESLNGGSPFNEAGVESVVLWNNVPVAGSSSSSLHREGYGGHESSDNGSLKKMAINRSRKMNAVPNKSFLHQDYKAPNNYESPYSSSGERKIGFDERKSSHSVKVRTRTRSVGRQSNC